MPSEMIKNAKIIPGIHCITNVIFIRKTHCLCLLVLCLVRRKRMDIQRYRLTSRKDSFVEKSANHNNAISNTGMTIVLLKHLLRRRCVANGACVSFLILVYKQLIDTRSDFTFLTEMLAIWSLHSLTGYICIALCTIYISSCYKIREKLL